jgi:hypothetical protein
MDFYGADVSKCRVQKINSDTLLEGLGSASVVPNHLALPEHHETTFFS